MLFVCAGWAGEGGGAGLSLGGAASTACVVQMYCVYVYNKDYILCICIQQELYNMCMYTIRVTYYVYVYYTGYILCICIQQG
jgi:hypothetical protein